MDVSHVGWLICWWRHHKRWSQRELAYRVGVGQNFISSIENGRRDIRASTLHRIIEAFGLDPMEFYNVSYEETVQFVEHINALHQQCFQQMIDESIKRDIVLKLMQRRKK